MADGTPPTASLPRGLLGRRGVPTGKAARYVLAKKIYENLNNFVSNQALIFMGNMWDSHSAAIFGK